MPIRVRLQSLFLSLVLSVALTPTASAQTDPGVAAPTTTMFPHQGDNSLRPEPEQALSRLWTIYTGVTLPGHTELLFDVESAGGRGLSDALGLAGFTNLDVVRNPTLGTAPYIARAMVHVTIPISAEVADATPTALSLAAHVPLR